jgi:translocation and assembly module TamB
MLLPAEGEAMLWEAAPAAAGTGDRVAAGADSTTAAEPLPAIVPDLEFGVHAPGGLWLRGQGLDVELAGDLTLRLQEGVPGLTGQLEALQGTMRQLGHVFQLERGLITFHGDEPQPDPQLDLRLGVKVSGTQVWITLGGRATEPQLEFSSEPPLSDGDIVSLLLFGKTADELDEGQAGLVADRAGQIALSYGATALQEAVAKEVGLDVVTVGPGSAGDETTTLTVGKYLSPRVLVRYEQILDEESGFYLHLDYRISGPLKLHTQVSQGQASGAEFAWEKDF